MRASRWMATRSPAWSSRTARSLPPAPSSRMPIRRARCCSCSARVISKPGSCTACAISAPRAWPRSCISPSMACPPSLRLQPALAGERLLIAPDLAYIETAFDQAKYGECSPEPALEITIPSVHDRTLAPTGKHVLSAVVQYAPFDPRASSDAARARIPRANARRAGALCARPAPADRRFGDAAARGHRAGIPHHRRPLAPRRAVRWISS